MHVHVLSQLLVLRVSFTREVSRWRDSPAFHRNQAVSTEAQMFTAQMLNISLASQMRRGRPKQIAKCIEC